MAIIDSSVRETEPENNMSFKLFNIVWDFKPLASMLWVLWGMLTMGSVFIFKADVITGTMVLGFIANITLYMASAKHFDKVLSGE